MREFKFRVWDNNDKRMYTNEYLTEDAQDIRPCISFEGYVFADSEGGCFGGDGFILMQYVGLKDNNNKEVYEGDILMSDGFRGEVFYLPCGFYVSPIIGENDIWDNFNESGGVNTKTGRCEWFRIIGNIYENPELVKVYEDK